MSEDWQRTGIGLPNPRTSRVSDQYMSAKEMDERMTALVEKLESAPPEMRQCPACGRFTLMFGSLWVDGQGWHPMQGCIACRRMFVEVTYEPASPVQVHQVRGESDVLDNGEAGRQEHLRSLPVPRGE